MIDKEKLLPGVRFDEFGKANAVVWAPELDEVALLLVESEKQLPLKKGQLGYWSVQTEELKAGDIYQFVVNDKPLPDPASIWQPQGVHGPSAAYDLRNFQWTDKNLPQIALKDYIIYELHTGTFTEEGTFAAMESKLDYLVELGINAIEIMPVSQFAGARNWGYDGVLPYCVQDSYGGPEALQHLVNACHEKGLAVILDVVYNHIGPEGNVLPQYGPYFTDKYNTPWGDAINFDDAWCDGVREYFIENVLMWFRDFHIDALRMDAVHAIKDMSPVHILQEMKIRVDELAEQSGKSHYLIVEMDLNDTRFISPVSKGGYGMDGQWVDEFHHALRVSSGQQRSGYYSDFEPITSLAKSYKDAYVYDGAFSEHRKRKFGVKADGHPGEQFVVFSQNHDHVGNRMLGERTSQLVSFEMQKLLAGAVFLSPYLPMLFMGEEYSESNPFMYFVSHTDPELAEAVRKGRKREFAAFHIEGEAPDPMGIETFNSSKLQWTLLAQEPHQTMFQFYKKLIGLRKSQPALNNMDRNAIEVESNADNKTLTIRRWSAEQQIVAILNFSKSVREIWLPEQNSGWKKLIASSDSEWNGLGNVTDPPADRLVMLPPESFAIFTNS
ncbi:malto-oligosyltrehalose trehalohydrolase [Dyadobacter fanqingshengii]|uniref:Malto-oligosyltrehalose trehalohydrolase n=1 Tax=Dyadobacter fanqingshengii TaxID=2906443 RepID=A0A9X1TGQ3_9BACT|nr:malto-oligosyltrehalose trehalohydrolase [Dyadobacter fanqingshengii]MCF0040687.1 malto-oligosyltrehalose trehalohydrolase [Dyadobacter fanqingshengii]USJ37575.1 malto-oligosyltrehalose trehalohydrolase [Dyadobacter fanqingshengii]